jgi:predicted nucleic acid-binding Zn ribbon protein
MPKAAFTILGALLIAGSAVQMATASEHHVRTGRVHHQWDRAYNQLKGSGFSIPQMRDDHSEGGGLSKPAASETRSCDRFWCYPD